MLFFILWKTSLTKEGIQSCLVTKQIFFFRLFLYFKMLMANPIKIYTKFKNRNDKTRTNGSSGFKTHRPQRGKAVEHG